ncbi:MAG TPA: hypothetical protein EYH05_03670 [Anaerolineae bacterium]|nr:hypothetical protein [Anaerolineae bacterium]
MNIEAKMEARLEELDFDFNDFTMDRFVAHIQQITEREILFVGWPMPPGLYGAWISDAEEPREFIFYDKTLPPLQKIHTQLHELAHIINEHPTRRLSRAEMGDILRRARQEPDILQEVLLRAPDSAQCEDEAETLAALIQKQVIRHQRLQQLTVTVSSDAEIAGHFKALGLI